MNPERYCTNCQTTQLRKGGAEVPYSDGLRYRWKCQKCFEKSKKTPQLRGASPSGQETGLF